MEKGYEARLGRCGDGVGVGGDCELWAQLSKNAKSGDRGLLGYTKRYQDKLELQRT